MPRPLSELDDSTLAALARTDPNAFGELYARHEQDLLRYFYRATTDAHATADLTADTFLKALTRLHQFDPSRGSFGRWLQGIARNRLTDHWRQLSRRRPPVRRTRVELDDQGYERIEQLADVGRYTPALEAAVGALPAAQAAAIRLRVLDDRPWDEVAAALGCSVRAARMRVSRALTTLAARPELAGYLSAGPSPTPPSPTTPPTARPLASPHPAPTVTSDTTGGGGSDDDDLDPAPGLPAPTT